MKFASPFFPIHCVFCTKTVKICNKNTEIITLMVRNKCIIQSLYICSLEGLGRGNIRGYPRPFKCFISCRFPNHSFLYCNFLKSQKKCLKYIDNYKKEQPECISYVVTKISVCDISVNGTSWHSLLNLHITLWEECNKIMDFWLNIRGI